MAIFSRGVIVISRWVVAIFCCGVVMFGRGVATQGGTLQLKIRGDWLDSLGSEIWLEKIFWGSSKILIWTIVRG